MRLERHLVSILILPGTVLGLIPVAILNATRDLNPAWGLRSPLSELTSVLGALLILAGLALVVRTVTFFARDGQGTLAPWDPTRRLVVHGVYRHVRNPMISGVLCALLGEALLTGSWWLALWFTLFATLNALYIPFSEEPGLVKRFGDEYEEYRRNVPRWVPRRTPWTAPGPSHDPDQARA